MVRNYAYKDVLCFVEVSVFVEVSLRIGVALARSLLRFPL